MVKGEDRAVRMLACFRVGWVVLEGGVGGEVGLDLSQVVGGERAMRFQSHDKKRSTLLQTHW